MRFFLIPQIDFFFSSNKVVYKHLIVTKSAKSVNYV